MATDCLPGLRNSAYLVIVVIVPLPSVAFEQTSSWNSSLHYPTQDRKIHLAKNAMFFCIIEGGRSRAFCFSTRRFLQIGFVVKIRTLRAMSREETADCRIFWFCIPSVFCADCAYCVYHSLRAIEKYQRSWRV